MAQDGAKHVKLSLKPVLPSLKASLVIETQTLSVHWLGRQTVVYPSTPSWWHRHSRQADETTSRNGLKSDTRIFHDLSLLNMWHKEVQGSNCYSSSIFICSHVSKDGICSRTWWGSFSALQAPGCRELPVPRDTCEAFFCHRFSSRVTLASEILMWIGIKDSPIPSHPSHYTRWISHA